MKYSILFIIFLFQFNPVFPKTLLEVSFTFSDEGEEITLKAGLDTTATDSIDKNLGEYEMPPLPPWGTFDIRIKLKGTNGILIDYRKISPSDSSTITEEYIITSQLSGAPDELKINYDISDAREFFITDLAGSPLCEIKNTGTGIVKIPANTNNFIIKVTYDNPLKITGLNINKIDKPADFYLAQNYPNPFNPVTVIGYQLPVTCKVELKVYDMLGREMAILVNEEQLPGKYEVKFDGSSLPSGVYFYRLNAGDFTDTKKLILIK